MSVVEGVTCFECGKARTVDLTDGYEAWAENEQQGWVCRACVEQRHRGQHFADAMRRLFPNVGFFHTQRGSDGRLVRGAIRLSWMIP